MRDDVAVRDGEQQQDADDCARHVGDALRQDADEVVGELGHVLLRGDGAEGEAALKEMGQLIKLANLPLRERTPVSRAEEGALAVQLLGVLEEEENDHEEQDERREDEVGHAHHDEPRLERVDSTGTEVRGVDVEVRVEERVEHAEAQVPLEGRAQHRPAPPALQAAGVDARGGSAFAAVRA